MNKPAFDPTKPYDPVIGASAGGALPGSKPAFDPNQPYNPVQDPSTLEALARGAAQGATFGFADELTGAGETAKDLITDPAATLSNLLDTYRKHRDESRANYDKAEKAHPVASFTGNLAGALAPALLTMGASAPATAAEGAAAAAPGLIDTVGSGMMTGLGAGAAAGLGTGNADLTKGEVGKAANETAMGAGLGALTGGALSGAGYGAGKLYNGTKNALGHYFDDSLFGRDVARSWKMGANSQSISGNDALEASGQRVKGAAQDTWDTLATIADKARAEKEGLVASSDKTFARDPIMQEVLGKMGDPETSLLSDAKKQDIINRWKNIVEPDEVEAPEASGLLDASGKPYAAPEAEPEARTPWTADQLLRIVREVGNQAHENRANDPEIARVWDAVDAALRNKLDTAVPEATPYNKDINQALDAKKWLGNVDSASKISDDMALDSARTFAKNYGKPNDPNIINRKEQFESLVGKLKDSIKELPDGDGLGTPVDAELSNNDLALNEAKQQLGKAPGELQDASEQWDLVNRVNKPQTGGGVMHQAFGNLKHMGLKGVNKFADFATNNPISAGARSLIGSTTDQLSALGTQLAGSQNPAAQRVAKVINEAATRDTVGRNALLFSLEQNPQYRDIINQFGGTTAPPDSK